MYGTRITSNIWKKKNFIEKWTLLKRELKLHTHTHTHKHTHKEKLNLKHNNVKQNWTIHMQRKTHIEKYSPYSHAHTHVLMHAQ